MKTPAYIQVVGLFNQTALNLASDDTGGELDPHGADFLGNPLGGLVYSTGLPSGDNTTYQQTESWNNFVGSNQFCIKLCDPAYTADGNNYCQKWVLALYMACRCAVLFTACFASPALLVISAMALVVIASISALRGQLTRTRLARSTSSAALTICPRHMPRIPSSRAKVIYRTK